MEDSLQSARQYLSEHNVLCLATCIDNSSWVSPVFYDVFHTGLIFLSAPHTRHCRNIAVNPQVSASVQEDYKDWTEIKGIQLEGTASRVKDVSTSSVIQAYTEKFPVTGDRAPKEIANALDKVHWFELAVEKLYYIDNAKGLGNRVELDPKLLFPINTAES